MNSASVTKQVFCKKGAKVNGENINEVGSYRSVQHEYANACAEFLDGPDKKIPSVALFEAGTGTGKSLGYLIPLLAKSASEGKRVAIATYTRQLQHQLLSDISRAQGVISQYTDKPITVKIRFGSDEYVHIGAAYYLSDTPPASATEEDKILFNQLFYWIDISCDPSHTKHDETIYSGRITDFLEQHNLNELPCRVNKNDVCIKSYHPDAEKYCYLRDVEQSKQSDVLIVTQSMLMLHIKTNSELLNDERPIEYLVIDEVDKIGAAAESVFQGSFAINHHIKNFERLAEEHLAFSEPLKHYTALHTYLTDLEAQVIEKPLSLHEGSSYTRKIRQLTTNLVAACKKALPVITSQKNKYDMSIMSVNTLTHELNNYTNLLNSEQIHQLVLPFVAWSEFYLFPSLQMIAINTGFLTAKLFDIKRSDDKPHFKKIIMTSATMTRSGYGKTADFNAFKLFAGVNAAMAAKKATLYCERVFAVKDYGRISLTLSPNSALSPLIKYDNGFDYRPDFIERVVRFTKNALALPCLADCGKRTLIVCNSFRESVYISDKLRDEGIDVIEHRSNTRLVNSLPAFRSNANAVLVTPSGWEGLDERIANLIICRIPFVPFDNVMEEKIRYLCTKNFTVHAARSVVSRQLLFETERKMAQGIGRLIRRQDDVGRLFIADPRVGKDSKKRWNELLGKPATKQFDLTPCLKCEFQLNAWQMATSLDDNYQIVNKAGEVKTKI